MYKLHHYFLCPSSRFIRIVLEEKKIKYCLLIEDFWDPKENYLILNPAGNFPTLVTEDNKCVVGSNVIIEFLEESNDYVSLFNEKKLNHEIRRIVNWFENDFKNDVINPILYEKIYKRFSDNNNPDTKIIRKIHSNFKFHLSYFNFLINGKDCLVGDKVSYADIFFASSLSVLDYLGELNFRQFNNVKDLYFKIKSRPSFKSILNDRIVGILPNKSYLKFDY